MISINSRKIIEAVAGIIYCMSPYNKPRKFDKIIDHIKKYMCDFEETDKVEVTFSHDKKWIYFDFNNDNDLKPFIKDMLMGCPEFVELNISQKKYDEGQRKPGDGIVLTDINTSTKDYVDFIDLGAAIGNIVSLLFILNDADSDCFLCKYAKEYESCEHGDSDICKKCIGNWREVKNYREPHPWSLLTIGSKEYKDLVAQGKIQGFN